MPAVLDRTKERLTATLRAARARYQALDHLFRAATRYKDANGDYLAAGVAYYSFLSIVPLLLLILSVAGFVLAAHPALLGDLKAGIQDVLPGDFASGLVDKTIANRNLVGIVGLLGVAYAGLGWVANLRKAVQIVWGTDQDKQPNFLLAKLYDGLALVGLGVFGLASLGLTVGASSATDWLVRTMHLAGVPGMGLLTTVVGIAIAVVGDTLVFGWFLARLPRASVRYRSVLKGAVFCAVGFELLKLVGTFYITRVSQSPSFAVLGGVLGVLLWLNLVSRFLLFGSAWTAAEQHLPTSPAAASQP
ncbi:MAG TPA: YhjD/YihY/BrkB family envelope integrity protein [Mycobacteriales bacterium]|nr:YhjD/YihY/BrkB family envelope integrity protein [Mycobacteriales bacterium]